MFVLNMLPESSKARLSHDAGVAARYLRIATRRTARRAYRHGLQNKLRQSCELEHSVPTCRHIQKQHALMDNTAS